MDIRHRDQTSDPHGLFCDENLARNTLLSRDANTIGNFLIALSDLQEHHTLGKLSHMDKVDEILRRSTTSPVFVPWSWFPPPPSESIDAASIAAAIENHSAFHFHQIPFEEIVRAALGYYAPSLEWFLQQLYSS